MSLINQKTEAKIEIRAIIENIKIVGKVPRAYVEVESNL